MALSILIGVSVPGVGVIDSKLTGSFCCAAAGVATKVTASVMAKAIAGVQMSDKPSQPAVNIPRPRIFFAGISFAGIGAALKLV